LTRDWKESRKEGRKEEGTGKEREIVKEGAREHKRRKKMKGMLDTLNSWNGVVLRGLGNSNT